MIGQLPMEDTVPIKVKITPIPNTPSATATPTPKPSETGTPSTPATPTAVPTTLVPSEKPAPGFPNAGSLGEAGPLLGGVGLVALIVAVAVTARRVRRSS